MYFVDTSALVKLYVAEKGSVWMQQQVAGGFVVVSITYPEVISALARRVKGGTLTQAQYQQAKLLVEHDMQNIFAQMDVSRTLCRHAADLAEQYTLRAYDSVQLAGALALKQHLFLTGQSAPTFLTSDHELLKAGPAEGLTVDDPNLH